MRQIGNVSTSRNPQRISEIDSQQSIACAHEKLFVPHRTVCPSWESTCPFCGECHDAITVCRTFAMPDRFSPTTSQRSVRYRAKTNVIWRLLCIRLANGIGQFCRDPVFPFPWLYKVYEQIMLIINNGLITHWYQ